MLKLTLVILLLVPVIGHSQMKEIKGGEFTPFFREKSETTVKISNLLVDLYPVTNSKFLSFVKKNPKWRKSKIPKIFGSGNYLKLWSDDLSFNPKIKDQPVVYVSWFAARAFCESEGKRLLQTNEWEYASDANSKFNQKIILEWYGSHNELMNVKESRKNKFGLAGMNGLIWEWVEDYSIAIIVGDSRGSNDTSASMFCGSGSLNAKDSKLYASFMRFAFRSSLKGNYTGPILGFRCAKDL